MSRATDTADAPPFDPAAEGWTTTPEGGFLGHVGPIWSKMEDGRRLFGFVAEPRHANILGVIQGGMLMTFADRGLGMLAWDAAGRTAVTISFETQFVDAGRIGSFVTLDGEVVRTTSALVFMRGLVTGGSRVLASCQGTWKILAGRRGTPGSAA